MAPLPVFRYRSFLASFVNERTLFALHDRPPHQIHIFQRIFHVRSDFHWFFSAKTEYRHEKVPRAILMTRMRQFTWRSLPVWQKNHENYNLRGFDCIAHLLVCFFRFLTIFSAV